MAVSVFSPCVDCKMFLNSSFCPSRMKARCVAFLAYIRMLHKVREHHILISELKELIAK